MQQINYIFVNDNSSKKAVNAILNTRVSELKRSIFVNAGVNDRASLISELCELRRHYPDAKILGVSEIDPTSAHAPVRVSEAMNALRRELSDLP